MQILWGEQNLPEALRLVMQNKKEFILVKARDTYVI